MSDSLSFEDKLKLESWGLPKYIQMMYENRGIKTMFPWQVQCLSLDGVLDGKNLIYSAPTSAGKTLVAEILCLQSVLEKKKKAIIILPFVSVVREKVFYFQEIMSEAGIRVEGFMGSYHPPGGFQAVHIAICTIEKANNLINKLMEEEELSEIGCVVVDELHMLGDPHRGYLLELLLTKLKFISKRQSDVNIQIVGMSATLPNLDVVACWLDAALFKTDFRPIPLKEYLKVDKELYCSKNGYLHEIQPYFDVKNDPGNVIFLCVDTILMGYSILVFCPTKSWCESLAQQISSEVRRLGSDTKTDLAVSLREQLNSEGISDLLERLKRCPVGLDSNLGRSIAFGVSFHHAGLTLDERDIVEGGFKEGIIRVLVATTTLSSGVNLPARRVLIRSPLFNSRPLDILTYKQMVGRAGRMGRDTEGESYLICSEREREHGRHLISSDLPPVSSCLASSDLSYSLTRAILEVVASGVATNHEEVKEYASCTLVHACDPDSLTIPLAACLSYLETNEFIRSLHDGNLAPSPLAQATLSASLYPHQAVKLLHELHKASTSFILNNHLHAIYQVTPYSVSDQWSVDWVKMFNAWESLKPDMKAVGRLVGVEDSFLVRAIRSNVNNDKNADKLSVHRRFYTALALQDLINESPLTNIMAKYNCNKGMLQSLQQSASTFAGMVTRFCERLGWTGLEAILEQLSSRIEYGAQKDLLDLLRLDCFTAQVARALFNSGVKTIAELASASSRSVQSALTKLIPFQSENVNIEEKNSKCIWVMGKSGLTEAEAAQYFIAQARKYVLKEMGLSKADWNSESSNKEIDSIYLNSTVNPFDLINGLDGSRRKHSTLEIIEPINNSTPVNSVVRRNSIVASASKITSNKSNLNKFKLPVNSEFTINQESLKIKEVLKDTDALSPLIGANPHQEVIDENSPICPIPGEPTNKSTPIHSTNVKINFSKSSRLSNGDMFESFDGIVFNGTDEILNEVNLEVDRQEIKYTSALNQDEFNGNDAVVINSSLNISGKQKNDDFENKIQLNECLSDSDEECSSNQCVVNGEEIKNATYVKPERSKTRNSIDLFFDSFSFNNASFSQAVVTACEEQGQALEELDCNWGGESLLETSLILNNISKQFSPVSLKRKLSISGEFICKKKRRQSFGNEQTSISNTHLKLTARNEDRCNKVNDLITNNIGTLNSKNQKTFQKNIIKTSDKSVGKALATSTQMLPLCSESIHLATCSEISTINVNGFEAKNENGATSLGVLSENRAKRVKKIFSPEVSAANESNDKQHLISDSEESIVESPDAGKSYKPKNEKLSKNSRLQISNVIKNTSDDSKNTIKDHSNSSLNKTKVQQVSIGLTDSYLEAAFGKSFSTSEMQCLNGSLPNNKTTNDVRKNTGTSFSNNINSNNVKTSSLKSWTRRTSRNSLILESQDVFMTPPREYQEDNDICDLTTKNCDILRTPTKSKLKPSKDSPIKHFMERKIRDTSVSPKRSKKEPTFDSPSKYNKLNFKIIKTPEKIPSSIDCANLNVTPSKSTVLMETKVKVLESAFVGSSKCQIQKVSEFNEDEFCKINFPEKEQLNCDEIYVDDLLQGNECHIVNEDVLNSVKVEAKDEIKIEKSIYNSEIVPSKLDSKTKDNSSSNPHIIFPCQSPDLLKQFEDFIINCTALAVSVEVSTLNESKSKIGSKIRKQQSNNCEQEKKFTNGFVSLDGLAFHCGFYVYYIDLLCQSGLCFEVLTYLFNRSDITLYIFELRTKLKLFYECCCITVNCKIKDPITADWLLDPQDKTKSLNQLLKEHADNLKIPCECHNSSTEESVKVWHLMLSLDKKLNEVGLIHHFTSVEMPLAQILVYMELTGIGFDVEASQKLMKTVTITMRNIEEQAHQLAGRMFNLNSRTDLSKIKRILNITTDNEKEHPLLNLLRDWRKLHSLKTRNLSALIIDPKERLHPISDPKTATGRITLYEPDLQHIPRNFIIEDLMFSPRSCFIPREGNFFVGADYCQLELRILAHMSKDDVLLKSFTSETDVFKDIAANWNQVSIEEVNDEMRHRAKQICYGLIYGMGHACLGEQLGINPTEAASLQVEFKQRYPGVKIFISTAVSDCKKSGFIKTLAGRTRPLPHINSTNPAFSKQGERQAVNSIIQGSASDIAKSALVKIESTLNELISERTKVLSDHCACHLVLHLHDEFIYEVSPKYLNLFINVLRSSMEEAVQLSLPLPVKLKSGKSWGLLESVT